MNKTFIIVKTQFEGMHCYPNAPEEVAFLKNPHRHMFHVEAEIEVFHEDRELEFILVKRDLNKWLASIQLENCSCETIAKVLQDYLKERYPVPAELNLDRTRYVNVKVFEDNENGAYLREL